MAKSNELKVGVFLFAGIVVLFLFIVAVIGQEFWYPKDEYYILMKFAGGLEPGVPVRYGGIKVGALEEIKISEKDNSKIEAVIKVKCGTPIKEDSEAFINLIGLMGEYYIEITTGSDSSTLLLPKNIIPSREMPAVSDLYEDLKILEKEIEILLTNINSVIKEIDLKEVPVILSNIDKNINLYSENIDNTLKNLGTTSTKLGNLIESIDNNFNKNSEHFISAAKNLNDVLDKSLDLVDNMTKTLNTLDRTMLMSGKNVDETMNNLNDVSRNLKEFSNRISERPWTIFRKSYEEERKK